MGKGTRSVVPTRVLSTELIATYGAVPGRCPEQSKHRKEADADELAHLAEIEQDEREFADAHDAELGYIGDDFAEHLRCSGEPENTSF